MAALLTSNSSDLIWSVRLEVCATTWVNCDSASLRNICACCKALSLLSLIAWRVRPISEMLEANWAPNCAALLSASNSLLRGR
ncbi:hypothetical protein D3C84_998560 [compost metagenome]